MSALDIPVAEPNNQHSCRIMPIFNDVARIYIFDIRHILPRRGRPTARSFSGLLGRYGEPPIS